MFPARGPNVSRRPGRYVQTNAGEARSVGKVLTPFQIKPCHRDSLISPRRPLGRGMGLQRSPAPPPRGGSIKIYVWCMYGVRWGRAEWVPPPAPWCVLLYSRHLPQKKNFGARRVGAPPPPHPGRSRANMGGADSPGLRRVPGSSALGWRGRPLLPRSSRRGPGSMPTCSVSTASCAVAAGRRSPSRRAMGGRASPPSPVFLFKILKNFLNISCN